MARRGARGKGKTQAPAAKTKTQVAKGRQAVKVAALQARNVASGHRVEISERIVTVPLRGGQGVFTLVPDLKESQSSFGIQSKLGAIAAHYAMWQIVGQVRVEWVPMTRQADGTIAMQWLPTTEVQPSWATALEAAADPGALVGRVGVAHTMRRSPRGAGPVACNHPLGAIKWAAETVDDAANKAPLLGFLRVTFQSVLTEPMSRMRQLVQALPPEQTMIPSPTALPATGPFRGASSGLGVVEVVPVAGAANLPRHVSGLSEASTVDASQHYTREERAFLAEKGREKKRGS